MAVYLPVGGSCPIDMNIKKECDMPHLIGTIVI